VVLSGGMIMEAGPAGQVSRHPRHPYTQSLLASVPLPDPERQRERRLARLSARTPGTAAPVTAGCPFSGRCPHVIEVCRRERPPAVTAGETTVACHRYPELAAADPAGAASGERR
jgi:peptide/nickel transport system ATP-binding protein